MLEKAKRIEFRNGQILERPDIEISSAFDGFLMVKHSGKRFYINKAVISTIEVVEQAKPPRYSFE